jgi:two-component system phosphate regulon sensor histidine kinase PhoR
MFIDTLREGRVTDSAQKQRCLAIINRELGRLDGLVGKLIQLSKIESRRDAFERRLVPVAAIIDDALAMFRTIDLAANIPVDVQMEEGLVVQGDRAALVQAVGNLLSNAWKYTPTEGRHIAVSAAGDLKHVYISVIDNGIGIAVSEQEIIFDKFQRGAAARERGGPGSGLGLAIVRAIVAAHDGEIDVQSKIDHGATFRIVLPRSLPEPA